MKKMKKYEQVFREIIYQALECQNRKLTQLGLSKKLGFSLSTINLAIKKLERIGSIVGGKMNFRLVNFKKALYYWASIRNLDADIVYKTRAEMPVKAIEQNLPDVIYGGYSAYKLKFKDVPADYSEVYIYADEKEIKEIKRRFPEKKGNPNLFILKKDENMEKYGKTSTIGQIFADLWNLKEWYAADFLKSFEERLKNEQ